jgi:hypothetical protein
MPRPRRSARALTLALATALAACAPAAGAQAREPGFDAERAFAYLERQVAYGPRVPGSVGHRRQLEWMRELLRARADTLIEQRFTHRTARGEWLQLTNLWAQFLPELEERLLLVAHWDTRPTADRAEDPAARALPVPGANDGASGTAVLLELAALLGTRPPPIGVDLLLTDGEDYGPGEGDMFLGAKHFAAHLPAGYAPRAAVVLDMVADRSPRFVVEGYSAHLAPAVVRRVWDAAAALGYGDVFVREAGDEIADDHLPLNAAGIPAALVIDFEYGPGNRYWHTPDDVPQHTSARTLGIVGAVMVALIYGAERAP